MVFELAPELRGWYPGVQIISASECRISELELQQYQSIIEGLYGQYKDPFHDISHITRALILASLQIDQARKRGKQVDTAVINWSVILHDVGINSHDIPDHGDVGAILITPFVRASPLFTPQQAEHIITNVRWHNKPHNIIPHEVLTHEFSIVTNADALDLVRMGDGRVIYLTSREVLGLGKVAQQLFEKTAEVTRGGEFDSIMNAASELGLVIA